MSNAPVSSEKLNLIINGGLPSNKLAYVSKQAISCDQVIYFMSIRNAILFHWHNAKCAENSYVDLLNSIIPDKSIKIKSSSKRVEDRLRYQCWQVSKHFKKLQIKGSTEKRARFIDEWSKVSILVSDVVTNAEMENELHKKDREMQEMQERLEYLYSGIEQWKRKYNNLEEEKEKLFEEMQQELLIMSNNSNERIEELDSENLELRKYINNLERECDETRMPITKNIHDISNRQKKRRIQTLGTRAQKALWFSKQFGLDLAALQFEDNKGQTYNWKVPETKPISQETPSDPGLPSQPPSLAAVTTELPNGSSADPQETPRSRTKQYDNLTDEVKCRVEEILFLMDKFAVGDVFIHELSMILDGMPKSYLIKQCRDKLNSMCTIKPTPGKEAGAQISFRDALVNNLQKMVSKLFYFCIQYHCIYMYYYI